jgi:excisionase family DNA binding protein
MGTKQAVVDSSGNIIECFTIMQAAKYLNISTTQLRLQLYRTRAIPHYKVFTKKGRKVVRIKKKDLDDFVLDNGLFDRIADRIKKARIEHVRLVTGISQAQLSRDIKITKEQMCRIERKKERVGLKTLKRIAVALDKPIEYFLD